MDQRLKCKSVKPTETACRTKGEETKRKIGILKGKNNY